MGSQRSSPLKPARAAVRDLWRCVGVRGDEISFVDPQGRGFSARVDRGRVDSETERWLRRLPVRVKGPFRVSAPDPWYGRENPDARGRLLGVEIEKPHGGSVTLEFFRGRPTSEFVVGFNLGTVEDARKELESWQPETGTSLPFLGELMSRSRRVRDLLSRRA